MKLAFAEFIARGEFDESYKQMLKAHIMKNIAD